MRIYIYYGNIMGYNGKKKWHTMVFGGVLKWGYPKMNCLFHGKYHEHFDVNWGYPYFRTPPHH